MSCKRAALVATALVGVSVVGLMAGGRAEAAWWSRPAPEDTELPLVSGGRTAAEPPPASILGSMQTYLIRAADTGIGAVSSAGSTLAQVPGMLAAPVLAAGETARSTAETIGQFAWEVAYVFGANGTPVTAMPTSDPDDPANAEPRAGRSRTETAGNDPARGQQAQPLPQGGAASAVPPVQAAMPSAGEPPSVRQAVPTSAPMPAPAPAKPPPPAIAVAEPAIAPPDPQLLANFVFDKAQRRPDGSFFVPKPLQRLFDLRTQKVETGETALSVKLPGRIIADPNAHGDVESSLTGRIEAPKTGLPVLGQEVKQGEVLGYVAPSVGVVDRTQVRREVARLTNEIRITAESLELLKRFWFVPFRDGKVIQAEMKLEGLRRERAALMPMLQTQEVLRASTDGVISVSNATNGRIVHPGDKIFEIVNPRRLWIEAVAADPDVAKTAAAVDSAVAVTPEGYALDVGFVGSGLALQQQAVPLMFRIEQPIEGLRVGRPVTVAVRSTQKSKTGIAVPRDAVVTGSNGLDQVWEHVAPEVFVPRNVKTETIDGRTVLVVAGLLPGAQIVTSGTRLLVQLQ